MAITAATLRSDFSGFLNREQAGPIFEKAARMSIAQRLAVQVPLGAEGKSIPVVTGRLTAGWVSEGAAKPASAGTMSLKNMDPKKLAVIAVVSAEVVRANPGSYMSLIRDQVAESFAVGFDQAAFHDAGPDGTATAGPFSTYIDQTTKAVEIGSTAPDDGGIHKDLVDGMALLVNADKELNGFGLDNRIEPLILGAVDANGRPIYLNLPTNDTSRAVARPGNLLGRDSFIGRGSIYDSTNKILGYGGDWTQAAWGVVGGISYDVSTEATVTINGSLVSLWEHNLVAVRAEAEYGWLVNDVDAFVKYTNTIALASA